MQTYTVDASQPLERHHTCTVMQNGWIPITAVVARVQGSNIVVVFSGKRRMFLREGDQYVRREA
jgi:hypothetical protein